MSVRIIHLSDPHFGTIKPEAMKALLISIKTLNPQAIVFSGDITQRARRKQFEEARVFTNTFEGIPILTMPGNHDIPLYNVFARFFHPYFGFKNILKGKLNQELLLSHVEILALNSTRRSKIVQGILDLRVLKRRLIEMPKRPFRIVVFHHPIDCPQRVDEKNLLCNKDEVVQVLGQHHVDLILNGHIHDPYICLTKQRYPNVNRSMVIGVAGTCLSTRTRADANNSFNVIDIESIDKCAKMTVTRYDLMSEALFEATESHRFIRKDDSGWQPN